MLKKKNVNCVLANENVHEMQTVEKKFIENITSRVRINGQIQVITLGDTSAIKVSRDQVIGPALFQPVLAVLNSGEFSMGYVMEYELSPFPTALFEAINVFI